MTFDKLNKVQRIIFMLMIAFLPFNHFSLKFPFAGNNLSNVCILLGLGTIIYEFVYFRAHLDRIERYLISFIGVSTLWLLISSIHGLWIYPYELGDYSFSRVYMMIKSSFEGGISEDLVIRIALFINMIRGSIHNILFSYFIIFYIYHIYKSNSKKAFFDAKEAIIFWVSCMILYSLIELGYLLGSENCEFLLRGINPFLMQINIEGSWWPPLLWEGQVRSLFVEPSFLGICGAMFFPFLVYNVMNGQKWKFLNGVILFLFILLIFLTRSRTAVVIVLAEIILFLVPVFVQKTIPLKRFAGLLLISSVAFCTSLFLLTYFVHAQKQIKGESALSTYVEDNVKSAVGTKRSNNARHAESMARLRIGLEHPVFGVGRGLDTQYLVDAFTEEDKNNAEVAHWIRLVEKTGPLKAGIGSFNYSTYLICTEGIPGLFIFFFFPLFFAWYYLRRFTVLKLEVVILGIGYLGSLAALFSNSPFASLYILSGLLLCSMDQYNLN